MWNDLQPQNATAASATTSTTSATATTRLIRMRNTVTSGSNQTKDPQYIIGRCAHQRRLIQRQYDHDEMTASKDWSLVTKQPIAVPLASSATKPPTKRIIHWGASNRTKETILSEEMTTSHRVWIQDTKKNNKRTTRIDWLNFRQRHQAPTTIA